MRLALDGPGRVFHEEKAAARGARAPGRPGRPGRRQAWNLHTAPSVSGESDVT